MPRWKQQHAARATFRIQAWRLEFGKDTLMMASVPDVQSNVLARMQVRTELSHFMPGLLPLVFILAMATAVPQPLLASHTCNVSDAYDLSYGMADAGDCSTLELQNSVVLTATSFSASTLVIDSQNLTIQSSKTAPEAVLDIGSYTLNGRISITGASNIMFSEITLKNYASSTVQNGTLTTFLPFFDVDTTSSIFMTDVRFLVDSGRCSLQPDALATPRTSWLDSLGLASFQGGLSDESGENHVQHAEAPLRYDRANLTSALPAQGSATVTFSNCSFTCPNITKPLTTYDTISCAWGPLELFSALSLEDSRTFLLQQSLTTASNSWGPSPLLIAESRVVYIVGSPNATVVQQSIDSFTAHTSSSSAAASSAALLPNTAADPDSFVTWSVDDNTDLLQIGYRGSLTVEALNLKLPEPCCITIPLVGSWYFSNQPLPWNIFGTILPGAFSVQAVRVPKLNAPAYLVLRNVSIEYTACDQSFAAAAELLVSKANAQSEGTGQYGVGFANQTITCTSCVFQGSEQIPSVYGNHVSQVELYDTSITCLSDALITANGTEATAQNATTAATGVTAGASWAPPVWLPVLLTVVTCIAVVLGLLAVRHYIRRQQAAAELSSLQEARNLSQPPSGRFFSPFRPGYMQRTRLGLPQPSFMTQAQKSKPTAGCPPSQ